MLQPVDTHEVLKRKKAKKEKYGLLKERVRKMTSWIDEKAENSGWRREVNVRVRDIAKEIGLEDKSDIAIYSGLRFVLFFEGYSVAIKNIGRENYLIIKEIVRLGSECLPPSVVKTFDNMELDGWYIKRNSDHISFKYTIRKYKGKEYNDENIYILESDGDIYFDRRNLTEEQALQFVKYMSSQGLRAPDFVYLTPLNIILTEDFLNANSRYNNVDLDKIGREFRIVKSERERGAREAREFTVTSIYGKECTIMEFDLDSIIKGCSIYYMLGGFDKAMQIERIPQRIEILKIMIPDINTKNSVMIDCNKIIIVNSLGTFHISLIDGTLHKIYKNDNRKYICVGPSGSAKNNCIIHNGIKHEIDRTTGTILAKVMMLLLEKYPDNGTIIQVTT